MANSPFSPMWEPTASLVPPATVKLSNKYGSKFDPDALAALLVAAGTPSPKGQTPPLNPNTPGAVPWGDISQTVKDQYALYKLTQPDLLAQRASEYQQQAELTRKQMSDLYPYMSAAATEAREGGLDAWKRAEAFKQGSPTSIQNIMASKQGQASSAADAEYRRAMGIAQQNQSFQSGLRFAGQTFQVG